ncbi:hypothetical protein ACFQZB_07505 [Arthrobacter ulcerisalmonis]
MATEPLSKALVVADGAARIFRADGFIPMCGSLADAPGLQELVAAQPSASAQARAHRVAALASPLVESVGESFSRAVFETLGFDQPNLQQNFQDRQGFVGRSDFWWPGANLVGSSTASRSTSKQPVSPESAPRKPSTGRNSARTGSGRWATALSAGAGRISRQPTAQAASVNTHTVDNL